jgi:hypothetical protein
MAPALRSPSTNAHQEVVCGLATATHDVKLNMAGIYIGLAGGWLSLRVETCDEREFQVDILLAVRRCVSACASSKIVDEDQEALRNQIEPAPKLSANAFGRNCI